MLRKAFLLFAVLILHPSFVFPETIYVQIKGIDDGVKTTKHQDYEEAVLFAKRKAIEWSGVKVKAVRNAKDFIVHSDYIESKAEGVLLPGYNIIDVGYLADGTYLIILVGKVKTTTFDSNLPVVDQQGSFIKYANGIVYDKKTGLEWYTGPDRNTDWYEAKQWVENLTVGGFKWRMPSLQEIETLYKEGAGKYNMTPLLKTTGFWVWLGETDDSSSAYYFDFTCGFEFSQKRIANIYRRGFAVRSRK